MALSLNNTGNSTQNNQSSTSNQPGIQLEGSLYQNVKEDLGAIGAGITTLIGGIFGYDKEARQGLTDTFNMFASDTNALKNLGDAILSTYNLSVDDIGKMPLGEMTANVIEGAWKHPITALLDVTSIASGLGLKLPKSLKNKMSTIDDMDTRVRLAEDLTKENILQGNLGNKFASQIKDIASKYNPKEIAAAMQAIETVGFKNAPANLKPIMDELSKANDTYKQFVELSGAKIFDDIDFAAKELIAREYNIPFEELNKSKNLTNTQLYKDTVKYVQENDVRPLFHLEPIVKADFAYGDELKSSLFKRTFGSIDYDDAVIDLAKKASDFVDKAIQARVVRTPKNLNAKIRDYNKANNTKVKELDVSSSAFNNRFLNELNSELKKTMLGAGTYLGANIITTTLSILNNFDLNAIRKTFKNLPKFRLVELSEAETPLLKYISKVNNFFYRPVASIDRYLENIGALYIENIGLDKADLLQSIVPSKVTATNELQSAIKSLIPFGNYPLAAVKEVAAHVQKRPIRSLIYNQIPKIGEQVNEEVQANTPGLTKVDRTKAIRLDEDGQLIQRNTVVTPIQAANMFLLGQQGDAIQIPIMNFLNKLISGKGDPSIFEVNGRTYKVDKGTIKTSQGEFSLIPSLSYIGRNILTPVQFYNQVLVPLLSDKYYKDDTMLFNKLIDDSQYATLGTQAQRKITDKAREKLGKRVLGTYEYDYYKPFVSPTDYRKVRRKESMMRRLRDL